MKNQFYKKRQGKMISGVLAGISEKFDIDVTLLRILYVVFSWITPIGLPLYIAAAIILPYKEDLEHDRYSQQRKRKDAEVINDDDDWVW
jgi:phage shock protein PspC (stress-responsive transcriptional regulator)